MNYEKKYIKYKTRYIDCINKKWMLEHPPYILLNKCQSYKGLTSMIDWFYSYNYPLGHDDEIEFSIWINNMSTELKRDLIKEQFTYDFRIFWLHEIKNKQNKYTNSEHFSDIGKKPNHITFSIESYWNEAVDENGVKQIGGIWKDLSIEKITRYEQELINGRNYKWLFIPSEQMLSNNEKMSELIKYFNEYEKESLLIIPEPKLATFDDEYIIKEGDKIFCKVLTCEEYEKYKLGLTYYHPKFGKLNVVSMTNITDVKYIPHHIQKNIPINLLNGKIQFIYFEIT